MSKDNGFLQLRRGIWEHLRVGSLTPIAALAYIFMLSEADTRTGIWKGSAQCIATALCIPKSTAKYVLKCLDGKYIRRFPTPGKHSCYPILLHRFVITQGQHLGLMLDALNSANERELEFFEGGELPASSLELVPQRITENREERKKPAPKPAPPADPRHKAFFDWAYQAFHRKYGQPPTWGAREGKELRLFLQAHKHITSEEWERRLRNFLDSTEAFTVKQGGSLVYFIQHFDSFLKGPVPNGGAQKNGKLAISDSNKYTDLDRTRPVFTN